MRFLCATLVLLVAGLCAQEDIDLQLTRAYESYLAGERAQTLDERQAAFNRAATLYHGLAQDVEDGALYYNLANCHYQLGELPWALVYYYKARRLSPRDEKVLGNLRQCEKQLGVEVTPQINALDQMMFFHRLLSPDEKQQALRGALFGAFLMWSCWYWLGRRWCKTGALVFGAMALLQGASLFYVAYMAPLEAVVVRASPLRRDAGHHYAIVNDAVVSAGMKVTVLDVVKEGHWVKVQTREGIVGYVPHEQVQII